MNSRCKYYLSRLMLLFLIIAGANNSLHAQDVQSSIPAAVQKSFKQKFGAVNEINWIIEKGFCTVSFIQHQKQVSASFKNDGTWIMTSTEIKTENIPAQVIKSLRKSFAVDSILQVREIQKKDKPVSYAILIKDKEDELLLTFSNKGELLNKTEEESDFD